MITMVTLVEVREAHACKIFLKITTMDILNSKCRRYRLLHDIFPRHYFPDITIISTIIRMNTINLRLARRTRRSNVEVRHERPTDSKRSYRIAQGRVTIRIAIIFDNIQQVTTSWKKEKNGKRHPNRVPTCAMDIMKVMCYSNQQHPQSQPSSNLKQSLAIEHHQRKAFLVKGKSRLRISEIFIRSFRSNLDRWVHVMQREHSIDVHTAYTIVVVKQHEVWFIVQVVYPWTPKEIHHRKARENTEEHLLRQQQRRKINIDIHSMVMIWTMLLVTIDRWVSLPLWNHF